MFDGVVRVISNVKHVPNTMKNLISLGVLDDLGYSYSSKGGIMKITKGALIVMKGKKKVSMLYRLIGNTVIGRVAVTTTVESSIDDTKLWHILLSHIGERVIKELHKRSLLKGVKTCKLDFCEYCVLVSKQALIQVKEFLTMFIQMFKVQFQFLLIVVLSILLVSLLTTPERYGFYFINHIISLMCLAYLKSGKHRLKIRLAEK